MKGIVELHKNNGLVKKISIIELEVKEDKIIEKSKEIFEDSDPCIIHRTYCKNEILFNFKNRIERESDIAGKLLDIKNLPEIFSCIDVNILDNKINFIKIY